MLRVRLAGRSIGASSPWVRGIRHHDCERQSEANRRRRDDQPELCRPRDRVGCSRAWDRPNRAERAVPRHDRGAGRKLVGRGAAGRSRGHLVRPCGDLVAALGDRVAGPSVRGIHVADGIAGIVSAVRAARQDERWACCCSRDWPTSPRGSWHSCGPRSPRSPSVCSWHFGRSPAAPWGAAAFRLTQEHGRWSPDVSGAVSIIFGVLLATSPLWGARVLTWWLGVYALVFGVSMLVVALKLRAGRWALDRLSSLRG